MMVNLIIQIWKKLNFLTFSKKYYPVVNRLKTSKYAAWDEGTRLNIFPELSEWRSGKIDVRN
jgi:hypothetical protein